MTSLNKYQKIMEKNNMFSDKQKQNNNKNTIRRYTNLTSLLHILQTKRITLLNPASWDDKNDAYFMAEYKRLSGFQTVLALCFTESNQTYHHWRVFANGSDGICIEFDKEKLVNSFSNIDGIKMDYVKYAKASQAKLQIKISTEQLAFLKREQYKDENEYRMIYSNKTESFDYKDISIRLDCIKKITLSPWLSKSLKDSVSKTIRSIEGCNELNLFRSTLIESMIWRDLTNHATQKDC